MESFEALERIDVDRVYAEAEQLLAAGEVKTLDQFLHALESKRQHYLDVEKQATATVRQHEDRKGDL